TNQAVPATFTQDKTEGCGPLSVTFVNTSVLSAGATFTWDFGNGKTSTQTNPAPVTFDPEPTGRDTTYIVTLTSFTSCGSNSVTSTVFVKAKPVAVFSPSKTDGCSPMLVNFTNTSPGSTNRYFYDFGDGTPILEKTDKSPVSHTYNTTTTQTFRATLTVVNECGTDVRGYNIRVAPQNITPELVVDASEKEGCAPLLVNFDNNSIGATRFTFDFGDGGTANTVSPGRVQHTFTRPGTYTVTMTAYNSCSEIATTETITVLPQPVADFNADITLGCAGLAVQFRNTTQDGFSYRWDFGDGTTSDEFEPIHTYDGEQEYYTVTLTATNTLGCSIAVIKNQYIHIVLPPVARFNVNPSTVISIPNYTFRFEDESTNNPTIWAWDFGDGTTSSLQNPSHTYADTGSYVVRLRVSNQQGCSTSTFKTVQIVGVPGYLFVPNSFMPGGENPELREFKAKGSGIKTWKMSVFNKWGQTLWETTELNEGRPAKGWDGTFQGIVQPQGVFFWKIDIEFINGTEWKGMTYDSSAPKKTGVIHLIR
ncbi:MAG: PKD domain-containing protein, partial [Pedobacter sp.]|nr:PKD domain-containing protein [Pedobacter sp.]